MQKDSKQNLGILAIGLGLALYIAADQGLFNFSKIDSGENALQPAKELTRATSEIKKELETISKGVATKQTEIEDLTSRLSSLKIEISKRTRELRQIDPRSMREPANTSASRSNGYAENASAVRTKRGLKETTEGESEAERTFPAFKTIEDLENARQAWKLEPVHSRTTDASGQPTELFAFGSLFARDSIYLSGRGLRWAQLVSKAAHDMGGERIEVTYSRGSRVQFSKAAVLRDYLAGFVTSQVDIALSGVDSVDSNEIDVFVKLEEER